MDQEKRIPRHVAIIMDGNGRWAAERGKERVYGHLAGVESVRACAEAAVEDGIKFLSLFAFSEENWGRPEAEVGRLMELMVQSMKKEFPLFVKHNIRFVVLGNRARLSDSLNSAIDSMMEKTASFDGTTLIVFLSYSGKWDILQAAKKFALRYGSDPAALEAAGPEEFAEELVTAGIPDPDLLIRTSGEQRISNFVLWQCAYTEFVFSPVLWPDFRKEAFRSALAEFAGRDRRYGKVK